MDNPRYIVTLVLTDRGSREIEIDAAEQQRLTGPQAFYAADEVAMGTAPEFVYFHTADGGFMAVRASLVVSIEIRAKDREAAVSW